MLCCDSSMQGPRREVGLAMKQSSRRNFLAAAVSTGALAAGGRSGSNSSAAGTPIPMVHATDLYRPHNDPDDHWDLACVYALAHGGAFDLKAVLIDYPPLKRDWDPDVMAVAQMNYLTGRAAPVLVGAPRAAVSPKEEAAQPEFAGVRGLLEILRESQRPVVINIVGSTRDVALASKLEPELFASKCAAVYLNAGSGTRDVVRAAKLEYNVELDPANYAAVFQLPCPVYWMPCFEDFAGELTVREWGTYYKFRHDDVLPALSPRVQNYFLMMYRHGALASGLAEPRGSQWSWLRGLEGPRDEATFVKQRPLWRNMWCTGGFLHAAGLTVSRAGQIIPLRECRDPAFTFDPIRVHCAANGVTEWMPQAGETKRYIYHVRDVMSYQAAMTAALKSLLIRLQ